MSKTPHKDKLKAAINNPKAAGDRKILNKALKEYEKWIKQIKTLKSKGKERVTEMTQLLNEYKDYLEVETIAKNGSAFLKRQKGQLKLDNSILEEFLIHLIHPDIIEDLPAFDLEPGPQTAFMSFSFRPSSIANLDNKPELVLKQKDQDFAFGTTLHYQFSPDSEFSKEKTTKGKLYLAVFATEIKVNYDKTMFQECCGTAARLKQGCPLSKYFVLVEYLDMQPEDVRLTGIDNVFLLRKAKRLPFEKRSKYSEVKRQHEEFPISADVIYSYVQEIQNFIQATWYDADAALERGSFL